MTLDTARQVADAVMYEGYLLYPYRATSAKNQVRWQFGVLGPLGAAEAGVGEPPSMSAEVLLEGPAGARLDVHVRFLQVQARRVEAWTGSGWEPVDELLVDGARWTAFSEGAPREVHLPSLAVADAVHEIDVPGGEDVEELRVDGAVVGRLVRSREPVHGALRLQPRPASSPGLVVVGVRVDNLTRWTAEHDPGWSVRDVAARRSFVGTHVLLTASGARFVSLLDGPTWADADARSCRSERCWPVLVATDDGTDAVLVAPIVLGDHPAIAPESAGDLFDATEIDEILTLRILTLTDDEQAQARGTDPRAAALLDRCAGLGADALGRLHGARRPPTAQDPVEEDPVPWWDAGQEARAAPETDSVLVGAVHVSQGSRVRLRPSRRADAQDLFLAGLTAVVSRVYSDVDGGTHVAVVLEDDPASDLYGSTGRYYYFGPDELEPLEAQGSGR